MMNGFLRPKISLWGIASAAGVLGCLCTLTGFFGDLWWVFELTSHFRVQYAVFLAVIAALLCFPRKFKMAAVFAAFVSINLCLVLPFYFGNSESIPATYPRLRVVLLNVDTANRRFDLVRDLIQKANPDLFVLEEVDERWLAELKELRASYPHAITAPREVNFGIALFSKLALAKSNVVYLGNAEIPSVVADLKLGVKTVTVLGTHPLPPGSSEYARLRNDQPSAIPKFLAERKGPVILLGDLNATPWSSYFKRLLRETGLINRSPARGVHATWPADFFPLRIPIDHCLVSPEVRVLSKHVGRKLESAA